MPTKAEIKRAREAEFRQALDAAYAAADAAQAGMVEDMNALDCGFAWVTVHDASFQRWCRRQKDEVRAAIESSGTTPELERERRRYGDKGTYTGWDFWKPGSFNGQAIGIHEAGAKAFSETLSRMLGIRCTASSRLD